MFSGLAAAVGVGSGALTTVTGVLGGVLGTESLRAGGHKKQYVMVGDHYSNVFNKNIEYSNDLTNWNDSTAAGRVLTAANAVAYGKDIWVVGGDNTSNNDNFAVLWSTDGHYWHNTDGTCYDTNYPETGCVTVVYGKTGGTDGKGLWLSGGWGPAGETEKNIYSSTNGKNWTLVPDLGPAIGFEKVCYDIAWGAGGGAGNRFIATGPSGTGSYSTTIMYSDTGLCWINPENPGLGGHVPSEFYTGRAVCYGSGQTWLATGEGATSTSRVISSLDNGLNWSSVTENFLFETGLAIAYGSGTWVVGGWSSSATTNNHLLYYSPDPNAGIFFPAEIGGTDFTGASAISDGIHSIIYDGEQFIVTGKNGVMYTSPKGKTWTQLTDGSNNDLNECAYEIAYKP